MNIKKFQATSETEAILLAKEELGKNAIVMNIKTISPKGIFKLFRKPLVEVTAAVDEMQVQNEGVKHPNDINKNKPPFESTFNKGFRVSQMKEDYSVGLESSAIEEKLNHLQSMLAEQLIKTSKQEEKIEVKEKKKDEEANPNYACVQLVYNQLISHDVDEKYANQIITEIETTLKKDTTIDTILGSFYQKIILKLGQPKTIEYSQDKTKYIYFIGPTGVGKTTTIAKIASSYKVGKQAKIALITSDTYRIAAVEQLRTYANILDVPLRVIYSETEMQEAMEDFKDYDLVLIDTAGRSHKSREQRDDIDKLVHIVPEEDREVYLVLSATTKYKDLIRIAETYSDIVNYRLIFTKLDETTGIGNIFNIRMYTNAPLSYAAFGQNVPDDIEKIDAQSIARQLLGGNE
ncbi:flagellar biosynthesis protein FlhF [Lachnoclostridium phytofermentans]|uniref:flagellar biosynthesis protein FlhF n=1 Tax=Lachnoclostridium phytofermentans TaxID=66219 RepID=UPI000495B654|nr:flagellar biosynthesis protein FlhF [Lachnoclostridium phytofermentans]